MEKQLLLAHKLMTIIELSRRIQVLKNVLYYSNNSEFEKIAVYRSHFDIKFFINRFKDISTQELIEIVFYELFKGKDDISRGEFLLALKPEVLENTQVGKQHNVTENYSKIMNLLIMTICQKAIARDELSSYVQINIEWFRETLKIFSQRIEMRQFLKLLKTQKLTSFQLQLFINQFFKKEETTSISDFCGISQHTKQALSENSKISLPMSTMSCQSLILPTPYVYECFANYIITMAGYQQKISHFTELFNQTYNQQTFQIKLLLLFKKSLKKANERYTSTFFTSKIYKSYQMQKTDFDLKEFTMIVNELNLTNITDRTIKIFFSRNSKDGLLSIENLYNILNDNRLCTSLQKQICSSNQCFQKLLQSHFILQSNLQDIRQTIWLSQKIQLFQLFYSIDIKQQGHINAENVQQFFLKNDLKNKSITIFDSYIRLFGEKDITIRDFILQFVITL